MLLIALYTVRSERQFCKQRDYNLLFRWFLDMNMEEASFDPTVFTKNRDRLVAHDVAGQFFRAKSRASKCGGLGQPRALLCRRHAHRSVGVGLPSIRGPSS